MNLNHGCEEESTSFQLTNLYLILSICIYSDILDSKPLKLLYLSLVRSHLSYCSQVWAPQSVVKDILLIESVQRWATHFICKNNELSYRESL